MTLEEFRSKICDSMGTPQRKQMCFQATPTAETLEKFPETGSLWVEFCDEASVGIKTMRNFVFILLKKIFQRGFLFIKIQ